MRCPATYLSYLLCASSPLAVPLYSFGVAHAKIADKSPFSKVKTKQIKGKNIKSNKVF